ncbi:MAG: agmatine deiminase family protein, partial [Akkermansiaceae bacterium]|nr:agmatine deiminase family protein [Akkermansiaceae bacterium]
MTTAASGYTMPAEWDAQTATWLSWPVADPRHWGGAKDTIIRGKFAEIAAAISRYQTVRINAPGSSHPAIAAACNTAKTNLDNLELFDHPNNDVWCRDHGPIFVKNSSGSLAVTDWEFNAWGGKFGPWDLDNAIPQRIADSLSLPRFEGGMILEGGAIEVNGRGQLLTTEAVLLNPNRNPQLSRDEVEQKLRDSLGATEILWLEKGIEGDDTDGHIDDLARFSNADTLLACEEPDTSSPNHPPLAGNMSRLKNFLTPAGKPYEIVPIHLPQACEIPGWRLPVLPASYVNSLILNHAVLVPTFRQKKNDSRA